MFRASMFQTSMLLVLLCLYLTVIEGRNNSKNDEYKISKEDESSDFKITPADVRKGLEVARALASVFSSRLGLAFPFSALKADDPSINEIDSVDYFPSNNMNISTTTEDEDNFSSNNVNIPTTTEKEDNFSSNNVNISTTSENKDYFPSTNVDISTTTEKKDFFPSNNVNISTTTEKEDYFPSTNVDISTTTEKLDIVWGLLVNSSGIVPGSNKRVGGSEIEGLTSTSTTTKATDTRVTVPEHPTSLVEFVNAQLSLLMPMFTNFFKLTEHISRETIDTLSDIVNSVWDFFWDIIELFTMDFDYDYDYDYDYDTKKATVTFNISDFLDAYSHTFY